MADICDMASDIESVILERTIKENRGLVKAINTSNPIGYCLSPICDAHTGRDRRFCDALCASDYEKTL